jgi:hypothetical protein
MAIHPEFSRMVLMKISGGNFDQDERNYSEADSECYQEDQNAKQDAAQSKSENKD